MCRVALVLSTSHSELGMYSRRSTISCGSNRNFETNGNKRHLKKIPTLDGFEKKNQIPNFFWYRYVFNKNWTHAFFHQLAFPSKNNSYLVCSTAQERFTYLKRQKNVCVQKIFCDCMCLTQMRKREFQIVQEENNEVHKRPSLQCQCGLGLCVLVCFASVKFCQFEETELLFPHL